MHDPVHPGETLREDLDALGMSASELARRIEVPVNRITGILNGRRAVTGDTALRLGRFFGTSGEFWLNLQKFYELRCAERESGAGIGLLPTLPTGSKQADETTASDEGGAASAKPGMSDAYRRTIEAGEVLILDSSTFIREIGLMSTKGSALKHYLYCRGTQLVVPQAAAEEYERHLARRAKGKIAHIQKELGWLAQFCDGVAGWSAPGDDVIEERAKALAAGDSLGAVFLPESDDSWARARHRNLVERPPAHLKAGFGDCRIWEQCLELLSGHDVVFVAADEDFCSRREGKSLHPPS